MSLKNLRDLTLTTTPDNLWAKEPTIYMDPNYTVSHNERAELLNGRLAMLGFVAAIGAYVFTGQIIPGVF
jgi:hypothetical protein